MSKREWTEQDFSQHVQLLSELSQSEQRMELFTNRSDLYHHILESIVDTGINCYSWLHLRVLLLLKLQKVIENFNGNRKFVESNESETVQKKYSVDFPVVRAPFTLQRICEILLFPTKHYKHLERVLLSILKCLDVQTTLPQVNIPNPNDPQQQQENSSDNSESESSLPSQNNSTTTPTSTSTPQQQQTDAMQDTSEQMDLLQPNQETLVSESNTITANTIEDPMDM